MYFLEICLEFLDEDLYGQQHFLQVIDLSAVDIEVFQV